MKPIKIEHEKDKTRVIFNLEKNEEIHCDCVECCCGNPECSGKEMGEMEEC